MAHVSPTIKDVAGHKLLQGAIDKLTFAKKKIIHHEKFSPFDVLWLKFNVS